MDAIESLTPGDAMFMIQGSTAADTEQAPGGARTINGFNLTTGDSLCQSGFAAGPKLPSQLSGHKSGVYQTVGFNRDLTACRAATACSPAPKCSCLITCHTPQVTASCQMALSSPHTSSPTPVPSSTSCLRAPSSREPSWAPTCTRPAYPPSWWGPYLLGASSCLTSWLPAGASWQRLGTASGPIASGSLWWSVSAQPLVHGVGWAQMGTVMGVASNLEHAKEARLDPSATALRAAANGSPRGSVASV